MGLEAGAAELTELNRCRRRRGVARGDDLPGYVRPKVLGGSASQLGFGPSDRW